MAETFRDHNVAVANREILGKGGMLEKIHKLDLITARESGDKADAELVKKMAGEPEIMVLCPCSCWRPSWRSSPRRIP